MFWVRLRLVVAQPPKPTVASTRRLEQMYYSTAKPCYFTCLSEDKYFYFIPLQLPEMKIRSTFGHLLIEIEKSRQLHLFIEHQGTCCR